MKKGIYSLIGFTLFFLGILSLVLQVVGIQIVFLTWIDAFSGLVGFVIRLLFIIVGLSIIVMTRSGEQIHEDFFEEE